jgi:hypothetical protein
VISLVVGLIILGVLLWLVETMLPIDAAIDHEPVTPGCMTMALERELAVYDEHLLELLPGEGKYVVIKGEDIAGVYDTLDEALGAGHGKYGPVPFLIKKIQRSEPILHFSRDLPLPGTPQTWQP